MGKVKIKKKDTRIDMTAMSDVTVLLLTFFMLTSTFLSKEPVQVITPPSVSEEKVPDEKLLSVLLSPDGHIYMSLTGSKDETLKTEDLREAALKNAVGQWNSLHPSKKVNLTQEQVETFKKLGTFGVPMEKLSEWLNLEMEKRDNMLKESSIPIDMNKDTSRPNEFQIWVTAVYKAMMEAGIQKDLTNGKGIAVKADQTTPYDIVQQVMDNLQTVNMTKFSLMTALKVVED
ncbi:MAG: biopolymer transporter ExbD [Muribaculaceae bacterium]|nr:biopolymer transporter ExbD [Muribaculaceae bacterium]